MVTSQFDPEDWYKSLHDAVIAESILSRLVSVSEIVQLDGPNMRRETHEPLVPTPCEPPPRLREADSDRYRIPALVLPVVSTCAPNESCFYTITALRALAGV